MAKLISNVLPIQNGLPLQICVYFIWFLIFGWSVFRGLENGIKKLTNVNMILIFVFLIIIGVLVSISKVFEMELNSIGLYIQNLPRMIFYTDPIIFSR